MIAENMSRPKRQKRAFFDKRYVKAERRKTHNWALIYFGSIVMTLFIQQQVISVGIVTDKSMLPTLHEGNTFLVNKYIYSFTRPQRGDIVVLYPYHYATDQYVKRVIGIEGETLLIRGGQVYANGERLHEPYALGATYPDSGPLLIPHGSFFVMGDNRENSQDSRYFGPVPIKNIRGKIKPGILFPFR